MLKFIFDPFQLFQRSGFSTFHKVLLNITLQIHGSRLRFKLFYMLLECSSIATQQIEAIIKGLYLEHNFALLGEENIYF